MNHHAWRPWVWLAAGGALLAACGTVHRPYEPDIQRLLQEGRHEEALRILDDAIARNPGDFEARAQRVRVKDSAVAALVAQADAARAVSTEAAEILYRRAQQLEPANLRAAAGLQRAGMDRRHAQRVASASEALKRGERTAAEELIRRVLLENPEHREARTIQRAIDEEAAKAAAVPPRTLAALAKPMSVQFRDANLRAVLDVVSRTAGISFVLDKDVRPDLRVTISVRDAKVDDILRLLLSSNQLAQKIVNDSTVIIYPNTPPKQREYQELVVRTFYLANADVRQTLALIRAIVKTRDVFVDEKLNMLVMRDTPEAIRIAEKLVFSQDLAEPEVMLEVEVLEVGVNRLLDLGLRFPDAIAWSLVGAGTTTTTTGTASGTPGVVSLPEWLNRGSELVRLTVTNPLFLLNLRQQDGSTSVLANPRIRVKNREKAKVHIGDRVPVITTTAAATGGFVSQSVSYLDVGLKFEVEPVIYLHDEVGIKVSLEVSNIVREVRGSTSAGDTLAYQIGTRNANTVLRLRDSETQVLAGLISDEDRRSAARVPGLGELPVVGRLFSQTSDTSRKTEIVLLVTPRIIRSLARPDARLIEFASGTEAAVGASASGGAAPTPAVAPAPAPRPPSLGAPRAPSIPPSPGQPVN
jgi:general secretion pathway protein D